MNYEFQRTQKEIAVVYYKIESRHLYRCLQQRQPAPESIFEPVTFKIRNEYASKWTATFVNLHIKYGYEKFNCVKIENYFSLYHIEIRRNDILSYILVQAYTIFVYSKHSFVLKFLASLHSAIVLYLQKSLENERKCYLITRTLTTPKSCRPDY